MISWISHCVRSASDKAALAAIILGIAVAGPAQSTETSKERPVGRINFEVAELPPANVEVDLSQEMFKDLYGLGDAAIAGVAETLMKSTADNRSSQVVVAAEQLEAARQIIHLAGDVVREVRVRAYEELPEGMDASEKLFKPFEEQLRNENWETLVRVRTEEQVVRISVLRKEGALQGIFVTASDSENVVLANAVCDISPENVKKITSAATKIGLENGLAQAIEQQMKKMPARLPSSPASPAPVAPPAPPAPPVR